MTKDEFDGALAMMGRLSETKANIEEAIAELTGQARILMDARAGVDRRLDEISSRLGADPSVDAYSRALDDEVVELLPGVEG